MDHIDETAARSIMRAFGERAYEHAEYVARKWEMHPNRGEASRNAHRWHRIANAIAQLEARQERQLTDLGFARQGEGLANIGRGGR